MQDPKIAKHWPSGHHRTILSGYIFTNKAHIDNRKNIVKQQYLLTCPHSMVNFGLLTAEIDWRVWGTPSYFNGYRVLAALLHDTLLVTRASAKLCGVKQRASPIFGRARPSRWALAHISSWRTEQSAAQRYWRGHQRLEKATESMRACRWTTFFFFVATACE